MGYFLATVHLLISADSQDEACDVVSGLLSENGTHKPGSGLLQWGYTLKYGDYVYPYETTAPAALLTQVVAEEVTINALIEEQQDENRLVETYDNRSG